MGEVVFIHARVFRARHGLPAPQPPRIPRKQSSAVSELVTLGYVLIALAVLALVWTPILLAAAWLYRRLHH